MKYEFKDIECTFNGVPLEGVELKNFSYTPDDYVPLAPREGPTLEYSGTMTIADAAEWRAFISELLPPERTLSKYWQRRRAYQRKHWLKKIVRYKHVEYRIARYAFAAGVYVTDVDGNRI